MSIEIRKAGQWVGIALLFIAPAAYGDQSTLTLTGVGAGNVMAGVYTSPYVANIDGTTTYAICDDFVDDSFIGETWSATESTVADLGSPIKWASAQQQQNYEEAAWLIVNKLLPAVNTNPDPTYLGEISFAIWNIFDPGPTGAIAYLANYYGSSTAPAVLQAQSLQSQAAQHYNDGTVNFASIEVYTPSSSPAPTCTGPGCPAGGITGLPQEFLVVATPEPSSLASLGANFFGLGVVVFFLRKRIVLKNASAVSA